MMFGLANVWGLLLLPLALLPFLLRGQGSITYSSLMLLPPDYLSDLLDVLLKLLASICIVSIILGISGLFQSAESVQRMGRGAQMVMLFDSSTSMDMPFINNGNSNEVAASKVSKWGTYKSKGIIARELLAKYTTQRKQDLFAMFVFSGNPIAVLPLTHKQEVIQAGITAGSLERGLGTTDLGAGLITSLKFFEDKPFTGSRIVMLVSDGAAKLTEPVKDQIKHLMQKHRITLYWIYLRDRDSLGLFNKVNADVAREIAPEQRVHKFFSSLGLPYRAFAAENPEALLQAITEVNKLQNLPMRYHDITPKRDLSGYCYGLALSLLLLLTTVQASEIKQWR